jgi:hypothetical protein
MKKITNKLLIAGAAVLAVATLTIMIVYRIFVVAA